MACKLAFTHIPKTGGSAIERWAFSHGIRWGCYDRSLLDLKNRQVFAFEQTGEADEEIWTRTLKGCEHIIEAREKLCCNPWHIPMVVPLSPLRWLGPRWNFCVTRDPVHRIVSQYFWEVNYRHWDRTAMLRFPWLPHRLNEWVLQSIQKVYKEPFTIDCHIVHERAYMARDIVWAKDLQPFGCAQTPRPSMQQGLCNILVRFEHLESDLRALMQRANLTRLVNSPFNDTQYDTSNVTRVAAQMLNASTVRRIHETWGPVISS